VGNEDYRLKKVELMKNFWEMYDDEVDPLQGGFNELNNYLEDYVTSITKCNCFTDEGLENILWDASNESKFMDQKLIMDEYWDLESRELRVAFVWNQIDQFGNENERGGFNEYSQFIEDFIHDNPNYLTSTGLDILMRALEAATDNQVNRIRVRKEFSK
jgi:hypothetical protein